MPNLRRAKSAILMPALVFGRRKVGLENSLRGLKLRQKLFGLFAIEAKLTAAFNYLTLTFDNSATFRHVSFGSRPPILHDAKK